MLTVLPLNYFMIGPVLLDEEVRRGVEHQELEEEDDQAKGQTCVGQSERLREIRREIIYCKRAILSLSSSKILTPYPPLHPASVSSPSSGFDPSILRHSGI